MTPAEPLRFTARPEGRRRSPISLTPLIDVVFILLVFFMLASTFLDWRAIEVAAPRLAGGGTPVEGSLLVELRADGLRVGGQQVADDALKADIARRLAENPDLPVLLRSGEGVDYERLVEALDRLTAAGAGNLSLVAPGAGS